MNLNLYSSFKFLIHSLYGQSRTSAITIQSDLIKSRSTKKIKLDPVSKVDDMKTCHFH